MRWACSWMAAGLAVIVFATCWGAGDAWAQQKSFVRHRISVTHEMGEVLLFDLAGDRGLELLVVELDRRTRDSLLSLRVFQAVKQGFEEIGEALQLPAEVAMVGVGRFPFGAGLVLLVPGRLEIWPWRDGAFSQWEAETLLVESIFVKAGGALKTGLEWVVDLDGDGLHEIIVPRLDGLELVRLGVDGAPYRHAFLRTRSNSRLWFYLRERFLAYSLPVVRFLVSGPGQWKTVVAYQDGLVQVFQPGEELRGSREPELKVDLQPPLPFDPGKPWDPPLKLMHAGDLNRDGLPDLVFVKTAAADSAWNTNTRVLLFYGRPHPDGGRFTLPSKPDQVFVSEGFSRPILVDINGDKRTDLALVNVEIGFWSVIKSLISHTVSTDTAIYLMPAGGRYPREPNDVVAYSVSFSLSRFGHRPFYVFGDLNGDGRLDLMLSKAKEGLGIHWGPSEGFWDSSHDALLEETLPNKPGRVRVADIDGDGRDDLLFFYNRNDIRQMPEVNHSFTVLLSRYGAPGAKQVAGSSP